MRFRYFEPTTLQEALALLTQHPQSSVMAGGTDLLMAIRMGKVSPPVVIGLSRIGELSGITYDASRHAVRIGALATLHEVATSPAINNRLPHLARAAALVGSRQIRNQGTLVGNICNASPSAETAPALLTLDAVVEIRGPHGVREVSIADFFRGPGQTALAREEIVTSVVIPDPEPDYKGVYIKLSPRRAMDLAVVGVAALLSLQGDTCVKARIALGAVAPTPIRVRAAEELLSGKRIDDSLLEQAAQMAVQACQPISDVRGSAAYRRDMVGVLVKRALREILASYDS